MFGEGEEDLDNIAFEPGTAEFAEGEAGKLDTIVRAMNERPELTLVIEGRAAPGVDGAGLWRDALRAAVFDYARELVPDLEEMPDSTYRMLVRHLYYAAEACGAVGASARSIRSRSAVRVDGRGRRRRPRGRRCARIVLSRARGGAGGESGRGPAAGGGAGA